MYIIGFDVGSSSVKVSIVNAETGQCISSAFYPKQEMKITAKQVGWAEQNPELWWENLKLALNKALSNANIDKQKIESIGISYQMHGLVIVDKNKKVIRPSIIWCDSRSIHIGNKAFEDIGQQKCLKNLLNSPGNFTASKLKWVKDNEPKLYDKIDKVMLPGDFIVMKLTGEINTTVGGLSEGIFWDFQERNISKMILDYYGFDKSIIPEIVPVFSEQGQLSSTTAKELNLPAGIKVSYRAGDQPNNALSLNVLQPGDVAATAGTSGVVFGVTDMLNYDKFSRTNIFAHVNHNENKIRLGSLLCINGTGILNSWLKRNIGNNVLDYVDINRQASEIPIGSDGLAILPFGNGAERMLTNKNIDCQVLGLNFNIHSQKHLFRAAQEGIVFSFKYGIDIMQDIGIDVSVIRAGKANMFLSPIFKETFAGVTGTTIEFYNTDGSIGAALGAGIGCSYYKSENEAFLNLEKIETIEPVISDIEKYRIAYQNWLNQLKKIINIK